MRWYKRDPARVLAGLLSLNDDQKLVYLLVIELVYDYRAPLDIDDDVRLAKRVGIDIRKFRRVVGELLDIERLKTDDTGRYLYDERAVRELVKAQMLSERQARRGAKGATRRWGEKRTTRNVTPDFGPTLPGSVPGSVSLKKTGTPNEINAPPIRSPFAWRTTRNVTPDFGPTLPGSVPGSVSLKKTGTPNEINAPPIAIREGEGESKREPSTASARRAARRREALLALEQMREPNEPKGLDETEQAERPEPAGDKRARRTG